MISVPKARVRFAMSTTQGERFRAVNPAPFKPGDNLDCPEVR